MAKHAARRSRRWRSANVEEEVLHLGGEEVLRNMLRTEFGEAVYVEVHVHLGEHGDVGDHEDVVVGRAKERVVVVVEMPLEWEPR